MKHIKTFERKTPAYKKYVTTIFSNRHYFILETNQNNSNPNLLQYIAYYEYNMYNGILADKALKNSKNKEYDEYILTDLWVIQNVKIIHQSDSLEDSKNTFDAIFDANKFNL